MLLQRVRRFPSFGPLGHSVPIALRGAHATEPVQLPPLGLGDCARSRSMRSRFSKWTVPTPANLHRLCCAGRNPPSCFVGRHSRSRDQLHGSVLFLLDNPSCLTFRPSDGDSRALPAHPCSLPRRVGTCQAHPSGDRLNSPLLYHDHHVGELFSDNAIHPNRRTRARTRGDCNSADAFVHQSLLPNPVGTGSHAGGAGTLFLFHDSGAE